MGARIRSRDEVIGMATIVERSPLGEHDGELLVVLCQAIVLEMTWQDAHSRTSSALLDVISAAIEGTATTSELDLLARGAKLTLPRRSRVLVIGLGMGHSGVLFPFLQGMLASSLPSSPMVVRHGRLVVLLDLERHPEVPLRDIQACFANIPIRIGVNAGSLDEKVAARQDLTLPEKLVASAEGFVEHFRDRGFLDLVLSAKAHSVPTTLATYRALSRALPEVPLHVGVTEAGTLRQGTVKNAAGVGILLEQGIGDTMRLSLTADPVEEVVVAWELLSALGMRRRTPELVSCPTCGRCQVDMIPIAEEVGRRLSNVKAPISVAVMGCVVNGPGEATDADLGVACGRGQAMLFEGGKPLRKVGAENIVDELMAEIDRRFPGAIDA